MKHAALSGFASIICLLWASVGFTQEIHFESDYPTALEKAKQSNKPLFIDFYATWCGPCKYLEQDVFTDKGVADYFNTHYVSLRVDAEKEEQALVERIGVSAYPTLLFLSPEGEEIKRQVGAVPAAGLLELAAVASELLTFDSQADITKMKKEELQQHLNLLRQQDFARAREIALQQLDQTKGYSFDDFELFLITNFLFDYHHPAFQQLLQRLDQLKNKREQLMPYFSMVSEKIVDEAALEVDEKLLRQSAHLNYLADSIFEGKPRDREFYLLQSKVDYYIKIDDKYRAKEQYKYIVKEYYFNEPEALAEAILNWYKQAHSPEDKKVTIRWAEQLYKLEKSYRTNVLMAISLAEFSAEKALPFARKALELAESEEEKQWLKGVITDLQKAP